MKHTLSEVRERFFMCKGRRFVQKILNKSKLCRRYKGPSFSCPIASEQSYVWRAVLHFILLASITLVPYIWKIFLVTVMNFIRCYTDDVITLYTCGSTRGVALDIVSSINSLSFICNFQKSINQRGCLSHVISDCGRNLISFPAQSFVNNRGITWYKNPALSPWHVCFFFFWAASEKY